MSAWFRYRCREECPDEMLVTLHQNICPAGVVAPVWWNFAAKRWDILYTEIPVLEMFGGHKITAWLPLPKPAYTDEYLRRVKREWGSD